MALAAYPFFMDLMAAVGRLIALQSAATLAQLTRRMIENWGDRSTLRRAVQRVLRSVVQWGILKDGRARGSYVVAGQKILVPDDRAVVLLEGPSCCRGLARPRGPGSAAAPAASRATATSAPCGRGQPPPRFEGKGFPAVTVACPLPRGT
jgi:hypothetical protein